MKLPVEDDFNDVLGKAQKGLQLSTDELAEKSGLTSSQIRSARSGEFNEEVVSQLGKALGLNVGALLAIGRKDWHPQDQDKVEGFVLLPTAFYDLHVNAYVMWDVSTKRALAFDTGTDPEPILSLVKREGLKLECLFLTHGHRDHVMGTERIVEECGSVVYISKADAAAVSLATIKIGEGFEFELDALRIETIATPGHTAGGLTFVVDGLAKKVAVVGDALFAGSMGGANESYDQGLESLEKIVELGDDVVLASGHGPLTTVGEERRMNCFWTQG